MKRCGFTVFEIVEEVLRNFLNENDEKKREEFQKLINEPALLNNGKELADRKQVVAWLKEPSRFSSQKAYSEFKVYVRGQQRQIWRRRIRYVAAVLILPFLVGGIYYWHVINSEKEDQNSETQLIHPIAFKASIELDDGKRVYLGAEEGKITLSDQTEIIRDQKQVVYAASDSLDVHKMIYHDLCVPRGGEYALVLSDSTKIWINADSKLRYPVQFNGKEREVFLLEGEAYFEVTKNSEKPFLVRTSRGTVKVLGTEFNVRNYKDEGCVVTTLVNGSVQFGSNQNPESNTVLRPGYQIIAGSVIEDWIVQKVNLKEYVGWKEGLYVFNNMTLEELMRTVERNYDVTVFFASEECKFLRFSGDLRKYDDVRNFLRYIEIGGDVRFVIKERVITIYKK
ncbi:MULTISPECIES: FecR family protein [Butyricimonas]|jgi:hypothetical protein|uniref:FecR domain-containing protein n=1 Tax=Butyricimonas hominis TaxID=2763032 RepID=A0ABR7D1U8_9BACT|nr:MULTISPECIES: FecR domain-containing protein [Butyricimonas]MBC5621345.1 FecR domain-containing protein [Butyricimonas hominis]MCB6973916.1 FecR domain-containing protein [Butyricimonas synergistica]MCG4520741.1 FecR domain-containing protein [Butyricimonas sp. DFI.6.44]